jgi:hypothetical protein
MSDPLSINQYYLALKQGNPEHPEVLFFELALDLFETLSKRQDLINKQAIHLGKTLLCYGPQDLGNASFLIEAFTNDEYSAVPGKSLLKYSSNGFEFWLRDKITDAAIGNHLVGEIPIYPEMAWTYDNGVAVQDPEFNIYEHRQAIHGMANEDHINIQICNRLGKCPVFCKKRVFSYGPEIELDLLSEVQLRTHQYLNPDLTGARLIQTSESVFAEVSVANGLPEGAIIYRTSLKDMKGISPERSIQDNLEALFEGGDEAQIYKIEPIFLTNTE